MFRYVVATHLDSKDYAFGEMEQLRDVQEQNLEEERNDYMRSVDDIEQEVVEPMYMIIQRLVAGFAGLFFLNVAWKSPGHGWMIIRMVLSQYFLSAVRRKGRSQTELVHGCSFWSVFSRNVPGEVGWAPTSHAIGGLSAYKVVEDAS